MNEFQKYSKNLQTDGNFVYSYYTKVARIEGNKLIQLMPPAHLGKWSVTTQKHINYVSRELNLNLIK